MSDHVNYPDVLGAITGGARCNIGVAQAALAVRPRVVRAGRPFEIILLLQNASGVDVDVTMTLHLPEVDAQKQRGKFVSKTTRLVIGMASAGGLCGTARHHPCRYGSQRRIKLPSKWMLTAAQTQPGA
jgi:hypothetical protein